MTTRYTYPGRRAPPRSPNRSWSRYVYRVLRLPKGDGIPTLKLVREHYADGDWNWVDPTALATRGGAATESRT